MNNIACSTQTEILIKVTSFLAPVDYCQNWVHMKAQVPLVKVMKLSKSIQISGICAMSADHLTDRLFTVGEVVRSICSSRAQGRGEGGGYSTS